MSLWIQNPRNMWVFPLPITLTTLSQEQSLINANLLVQGTSGNPWTWLHYLFIKGFSTHYFIATRMFLPAASTGSASIPASISNRAYPHCAGRILVIYPSTAVPQPGAHTPSTRSAFLPLLLGPSHLESGLQTDDRLLAWPPCPDHKSRERLWFLPLPSSLPTTELPPWWLT